MRATYKLGRDVIAEFEAQNAGNSISGVQISKHFPGEGGGGVPGIGMSHGQGMRLDPRLGLNSLTAGGATEAVNQGKMSNRLLKIHGRWKTDVARRMDVHENIKNKLAITGHLGL